MARGSMNCISCGKEVPKAAAKNWRGRCYQCWRAYQSKLLNRGRPYFLLRNQEDLLNAAYQSAPWIFRAFRLSLPAFLVQARLRGQYRNFRSKLAPGERVWPFHFNKWSLAMRRGFLVVKDGKPDRVWITEMS